MIVMSYVCPWSISSEPRDTCGRPAVTPALGNKQTGPHSRSCQKVLKQTDLKRAPVIPRLLTTINNNATVDAFPIVFSSVSRIFGLPYPFPPTSWNDTSSILSLTTDKYPATKVVTYVADKRDPLGTTRWPIRWDHQTEMDISLI
jgi:hypothetical protein